MLKKVFLLWFILLNFHCYSQCVLDKGDLENIRQHSMEMIEYLDDSFRKLSASKDPIDKERFIENLLTDFTDSCTIEVVNRRGKRTYPIQDYLRNVLNKRYRKQFKVVDIDIVKFELDGVQPDPKKPGRYIIKGRFIQVFRAATSLNKEGIAEITIGDRTEKEFIIYIEPNVGPNGCTYVARIGEITVKSVKFF